MKKIVLLISLLSIALLGKSQTPVNLTDGVVSESCFLTVYDPGGEDGNYNNNLDITHVFKSDNEGQIQLTFEQFDLVSGDNLHIYNGEVPVPSRLIGSYTGSSLEGQTVSSQGTGALTLVFKTNGSGVKPGFKFVTSCTYPCQEFKPKITSDHPITPATKLLYTCPGETVVFNADADFPNNNINYSQSIGSSTISWINAHDGTTAAGFSYSLPITEGFIGQVILKIMDSQSCAAYDTVTIISQCPTMNIDLDYTAFDAVGTEFPVAVEGNKVFLANQTYGLDIDASISFEEIDCYTPELTTIHWDYGHTPGGQEETINPSTHFYPDINNIFYNLTVEAEDQRGCKTQKKVKVYIGCKPLRLEYEATPGMLGDTVVACQGDPINIDVLTSPLWGDSVYMQTPNDLNFIWQVGSGNVAITNEEDLNGLVFDNAGLYDVLLTVSDQVQSTQNEQHCSNELHVPIMVYMEPSLEASYSSDTDICLGDTIRLFGNSELTMPVYNAPPIYLPDGNGQSYESSLTYDIFQPDAIIESAEDINEICMTIEHSYLGDLEIEIICPNGQSVLLKQYPGGGTTNLGEPVTGTSADEPGVGYTYCFTETADQTMLEAAGVATLPDGSSYLPVGDFEDLVGCPLNGDWTIKITDNLNIDDGWIFSWSLMINDAAAQLLPDTLQFPFNTREWTIHNPDPNVEMPGDLIRYYEDDFLAIPGDTGEYFFKYELMTPANCNFSKIVGPIHVHPIIDFEISPDTNLCNTLEYDIDGYLEGGKGVWSYEGPGELTFSRIDTIPTHVTANQSGNYTLTFTPNTMMPKCGQPKSFSLNLRKLPEITVEIDSALCYGSLTGAIRPTAIGEDQPYTYQWSNGSTQEIATGLSAGVYHVTVSSEYCDDVFQYVVEQPFPLEVGEYGHTDNLCYGDVNGAVWGKTQGGTQPYFYHWSNGAITDSVTNLTSGNYNLTVTDSKGCQAFVTQTVGGPFAPLKAVFEEVKSIKCFGEDNGIIDVSVSGGTQPYTYAWTHNGQAFSEELDLDNLDQGEYKLEVTDANNCTTSIDTIIAEPTELQLLYETQATSCNGVADGLAKVFATEGTPPYVYNWSNGSHDSVAIHLYSSFYNVTVIDNNGCQQTAQNIFVDQPAPVNISISETDTICIGESAYMEISATSSPFTPYTFYWNGAESSAGITVSPAETTTYTAKVVDANGCESVEKTKVLHVYKDFSGTKAIFDKAKICTGELVEVHLQTDGGNGNYTYQLPDGTIVDSVFTVAPTDDGLINVTIKDNCSTPPLTKSFEIEVYEPYVASFNVQENIGCQPFIARFYQDTTSHEEGTIYNWGMGYSIDSVEVTSHEAMPVHQYDSTGHYNISLEIITPQGCRSRISQYSFINVYSTPIAEFTASSNEVKANDAVVHFNNLSQFADTCKWLFGGLDSTTVRNPNYEFPPQAGEYEVMLIAENNYSCRDTAYTIIVVKDEVKLYIPTAFTPNGDGTNDIFKLQGNGIKEYHIYIYDRWNNLIYESTDLASGWNGTSNNGKKMRTGAYAYKIEYVDTDGKKHKTAGRLNLIR